MQYDKKLLLQMINDPSVPNDEKQMYKELVEAKEGADYFEKKVEVKEEVKVMKPAAKKKAAKKPRNIVKHKDGGYLTTTITVPAHVVPSFKPAKKFINRVLAKIK